MPTGSMLVGPPGSPPSAFDETGVNLMHSLHFTTHPLHLLVTAFYFYFSMAGESSPVPQNLAGKVAIISGASSGIGACIARELSARGAWVVINYPFPSLKEAAQKVLKSLSHPADARIIEADLSTLSGPKKLVEDTIHEFGKLDILINNAGVCHVMSLDEPDEAKFLRMWDQTISVNGRGTLLLTRAALAHLSPRNSRIINISSGTSRQPEPNVSIYAGSKGMVESFTRAWAVDLPRKYGCTVNSVAPGPIGTELLLSAPPELREKTEADAARTPVASRLGTPEEVAWAVAMLCDEGASWINGVYLPLSGGGFMV